MNNALFVGLVESILDKNRIDTDDVFRLGREVFPDGLTSSDEADILIALDRAVPSQHPLWEGALLRLIVDFVVWASRPTGYVHAETARWLTSSLACGRGPTELAVRIAFAIVVEAQKVDEALVSFVLSERRARTHIILHRTAPALAA